MYKRTGDGGAAAEQAVAGDGAPLRYAPRLNRAVRPRIVQESTRGSRDIVYRHSKLIAIKGDSWS